MSPCLSAAMLHTRRWKTVSFCVCLHSWSHIHVQKIRSSVLLQPRGLSNQNFEPFSENREHGQGVKSFQVLRGFKNKVSRVPLKSAPHRFQHRVHTTYLLQPEFLTLCGSATRAPPLPPRTQTTAAACTCAAAPAVPPPPSPLPLRCSSGGRRKG